MHNNSKLIEARIVRFVTERLLPALYRERISLVVSAWEVEGEPIPFEEAIKKTFTPFPLGQKWGKPWGTTWFHITGEIPDQWEVGVNKIEILIDLGFEGSGSSAPTPNPSTIPKGTHQPGFQAEGLVFDPTGKIIKALEPFNKWIPVSGVPGSKIDLYVEAASNANLAGSWNFEPTPLGDKKTAGQEYLYRLIQVELAVLDVDVWNLNQDILVLYGLMKELSADLPRKYEILRALESIVDITDPENVHDTASIARNKLQRVLEKTAYPSAHKIIAVGHAHIDSAWLWPVRETIRKCARTFSNVLELMDHHPDFKFACSSAQQFAWMKEFYPQIFEGIKKRVADGRFIPVGGMWVESDSNLPGSEALARQFIFGKGFFLREFKHETKEVWLPDTFGYSGSLPEIGVAAGAEYFFTQKLCWNDTDRMPHHSFNWEGIDGTQIFTHFTPVDTYNSDLSPSDLIKAQRQYAEKGLSNVSLIPFGWGDGGGGPTREMLAAAERSRDLEGLPKVTISSPQDFFEEAKRDYKTPPVWYGEMYLQFHRGVLTSQAKTKQGNRRSEHLLREAELWASTAHLRLGIPYPKNEINRAWEIVLLQQFHDILPGSSIAWVYQEAEENYQNIKRTLEEIIENAQVALSGSGSKELYFNASPYEILGVKPLSSGEPVQIHDKSIVSKEENSYKISNSKVDILVNSEGLISSIYHVEQDRELIPEGCYANLLQLFRDTPSSWDAWEIELHYLNNVSEIRSLEKIEIFEDVNSGTGIRIFREFGQSKIDQKIILLDGSDVIEITSTIDWHEKQKLLKLAFAFDIQTDFALSEIQFGNIKRPIHTNTSWDQARFETCAQRWLQISEPNYSVTVANDSTYGHDITRKHSSAGVTYTQVRETLLRAPVFPDPNADQGLHTLKTSIKLGTSVVDSISEGFRLNLPLRRIFGDRNVEPLFENENPNVVIEAVKLAEDDSGDLILRLYEGVGDKTKAAIKTNFKYTEVEVVDLLERKVEAADKFIETFDEKLVLNLRPFSITTLRFIR